MSIDVQAGRPGGDGPGEPDGAGRPRRPSAASARGRWALRDRPGVVWLLLAVLVALVHPFVPGSTWLMVHLVLLGALTHSAMVWSTHFTQALLRSGPDLDPRRRQSQRLLLLLVGTTLVLVGVPAGVEPVTVAGATAVATAVGWHAVQLVRRLRAALPGRFRTTVHHYLAASGCLAVGATLGAVLARTPGEPWHGRLLVAHSMVMTLGWVGLTVHGTLLTLWPTMLRTRMDDRAEAVARRVLPLLVAAVAAVLAGCLADARWLTVAGLVGYLLASLVWGGVLVATARRRPPREPGPLFVAAALGWLGVALVEVVALVVRDDGWRRAGGGYGAVAATVAVGFAAQLLTGALSYLVPSVLGGGPSVVRAGQAWLGRLAGARLVVVNVGLAVCLLPVPSAVRIACSVLVLVALAAFVPLMLLGVRASVAARRAPVSAVQSGAVPEPASGAAAGVSSRPGSPRLQAVSGLATVLAVALAGAAVGWAADPSSGVGPSSSAVAATGHVTRVEVAAQGMRFVPDRIVVPAGDRLVVDLVNRDTTTHDLRIGDVTSERVAPGERTALDAGVVRTAVDGWCTVVGHRMRGMTLRVDVAGAASGGASVAAPTAGSMSGSMSGSMHHAAADAPSDRLPLSALDGATSSPSPAVPAALPPLEADTGRGVERRVTLRISEQDLEVAPGIRQRRWTFGGVPGPVLHARVGDTFVVTLVNDAPDTHSVDFHAGRRSPQAVMRPVPPGGRLTYRFVAERAGIWMYHCSTMPMSVHIAAGMFGAVVVEPRGLPAVGRSYVLVQSETYLDTRALAPSGPSSGPSSGSPAPVDAAKVDGGLPDLLSFNGSAFQYDRAPLTAGVGERVRFWVLDAGPDRGTSFHLVGGQFDTVWSEGAYLLRRGRGPDGGSDGGSQALALAPAQGGFVEAVLDEPGDYPFVSHVMSDAERGAHGLLRVR